MSVFAEVPLSEAFPPFAALARELGFVPNLFRAQSRLPRLIEAEVEIAAAVLFRDGALARADKERLLLALALACGNRYCASAHWHVLRGLGVGAERLDEVIAQPVGRGAGGAALHALARKLVLSPAAVGRRDLDAARVGGDDDAAILETILTAALTRFLCTMAVGLCVEPDFDDGPELSALRPVAPRSLPGRWPDLSRDRPVAIEATGPVELRSLAFFERAFGFVPNIFRAQTLHPAALAAEAKCVEAVLLTEDVLPRVLKEYILLAVSAANLNTYCVAVHCEMLRRLDVPGELADRIALDHREAGLPERTATLLDFALKLARRPAELGPDDARRLIERGYSTEQVLEATAMTALTLFLNTVQAGVDPPVDFDPRLVFAEEPSPASAANPEPAAVHPISRGDDPDRERVARARAGDVRAYEELFLEHGSRIYRTMVAICGHTADAEDDTQSAFLKGFERLGEFRGDSRFATWLTRIAINEGLQRLRRRHPAESLVEDAADEPPEERLAPRRVLAWTENPEQLYAREELRRIVERALLELPRPYRLAVFLRDLEQLSGEEAAAALGVKLSTLKTRLLRGRLMLRDRLTPLFARRTERA